MIQLFLLYHSKNFMSTADESNNISNNLYIIVLRALRKGITSPSLIISQHIIFAHIGFDIRETNILKIVLLCLQPNQIMPLNKYGQQYSTLIVIIQANKLKIPLDSKIEWLQYIQVKFATKGLR